MGRSSSLSSHWNALSAQLSTLTAFPPTVYRRQRTRPELLTARCPARVFLNSQPLTINTMLAGPPRKAPLPAVISAFSFQHFSLYPPPARHGGKARTSISRQCPPRALESLQIGRAHV